MAIGRAFEFQLILETNWQRESIKKGGKKGKGWGGGWWGGKRWRKGKEKKTKSDEWIEVDQKKSMN